jgi:uncharacterized protein YycO
MNRGDIVLYRSSGKWYERAIVLATGGPFVHVGIATSDNQVIAAGSRGINYFPFSYDPKIHTIVSLVPEHATQLGIEAGLKWAIAQAGKRYSWIDIFYQAVKFLNPNNKLRFYCEGEYDCSDFCSRYLLYARVPLPVAFQDPYANSPNDIGRIFNLLPPRKA